ncbi:hypothetical protein M404DRAFT_399657 [Pisolithus tinctorius Marx 270]|uniref:Uncharacterized protein n=1 Tax=Pisolithus tinctorius Marx 270 TaxID=870435 RepID=A0A0C3KE27_PISTI|nr:hypothetical protein M404DRAFT_399657 [Pisolithus tinctorius Marx 270]
MNGRRNFGEVILSWPSNGTSISIMSAVMHYNAGDQMCRESETRKSGMQARRYCGTHGRARGSDLDVVGKCEPRGVLGNF